MKSRRQIHSQTSLVSKAQDRRGPAHDRPSRVVRDGEQSCHRGDGCWFASSVCRSRRDRTSRTGTPGILFRCTYMPRRCDSGQAGQSLVGCAAIQRWEHLMWCCLRGFSPCLARTDETLASCFEGVRVRPWESCCLIRRIGRIRCSRHLSGLSSWSESRAQSRW